MFKPVRNSKAAAMMFFAVALFIGLAGLRDVCTASEAALSAAPAPTALNGWQQEFEDICSRTQDAMTFSIEELTSLVQRCDALLPQIEKLDDTQRKVYTGRLRMCRGLYAYVLNSKKNEKP